MQGPAAFAAPFIADTPTITMSRLKALLTVSVRPFIDEKVAFKLDDLKSPYPLWFVCKASQ
jgi:hypothetical protein